MNWFIWPWRSRYQVSRSKPNPWRHGGRQGKKRPTVNEFQFPKNAFAYRKLQREGWRSCYPIDHWLRRTWLKVVGIQEQL